MTVPEPADPRRGGPTVLVVCTGNICRSPAAELLLRSALGQRTGIVVSSVGLDARPGAPLDPEMARLLEARGVDPADFRARQFQPAHAVDADLVLTMTAQQRAAVVTQAPAAVRRTFCLLEFADLASLVGPDVAEGDPGARLSALINGAPRARALRLPVAGSDDVRDPHGLSRDVFEGVFATVETAVGRLLGALGPADAAAEPEGTASEEFRGSAPIRGAGRWSVRSGRRRAASSAEGRS